MPDPVLHISWASTIATTPNLLCACADGSIKLWDASKNNTTTIGKHTRAVIKVDFIEEQKLVVALSFNSLAFWDSRSNQPAMQLPFSDIHPAYMSYFHPFIAVLANENKVGITCISHIFQANNLMFEAVIDNKLKKAYTSFEGFPGTLDHVQGYIIGNVEGRCEVKQFSTSYDQLRDEKNEKGNFTFKAHNEGSENFAVNTLSYNPAYGTFITGVIN